VDAERLRVLADDLTGACDVAAALLPLRHGLVVAGPARWRDPLGAGVDGALVVRNTQSRALAPADAAARVRLALADLAPAPSGVLLKKIDTGLRGPLGAEIDAAMDAIGAELALVVPAIPDAGRTTVDGRQLVDGVPVDETAFARDPDNPVRDARVGAVIEATSRRRAAWVGLDEVRRGGAAAAVASRRAAGARIVVGDAETDADLDHWAATAMDPREPAVLVGSTGLARAVRRRLGAGAETARAAPGPPAGRGGGVLVVCGSAHPVAHAQLRHAAEAGLVRTATIDAHAPAAAVAQASAALRAGRHAALGVPGGPDGCGRDAMLAAVAQAVQAVVARACPRALVLIGGETAFHVLTGLDDSRLWIERVAGPLAVRATLLDGPLAGLPVVNKGGSSGPPERLAELVAEASA
jgi:uncharacterized protein YgbK (DUF1537 family)